MARKSRKVIVETVESQKKKSTAFYKAAVYARLSNETERNVERKTIEAQLQLIKDYISESDDMEVYDEYADLSYTGTNFNRPAFERMIEDAKAGKINCIVVKDLSRLGRNYIDTAEYIERVFPFLGVRFIAVTDGFDSLVNGVDMIAQLKNVINEQYAKDISRKIITANKANWEKGKYLAGTIPYGYVKGGLDGHQLIIDETSAEIVRRIFRMYLDGTTVSKIATKLNEEAVASPQYYRIQSGQIKNSKKEVSSKWNFSSVKRVLENQYYAGDSVHGKDRKSLFEGIERHTVSKDEWIIIEDTHEAIIEKETFYQVQSMMENHRKDFMDNRKVGSITRFNLFKGKIKCPDCGKYMVLVPSYKDKFKYVCSSYSRFGIDVCGNHAIEKSDLDDKVFTVIKSHMKSCLDTVAVLKELNARKDGMDMYQMYSREISKCRKELNTMIQKKAELFEDYREGLINEEEYVTLSGKYGQTEDSLRQSIDAMGEHQARYAKEFKIDADWEKVIEEFISKRKLTKSMADAFVEQILVYDKENIKVTLIYDDMLLDLQMLLEERRQKNNG